MSLLLPNSTSGAALQTSNLGSAFVPSTGGQVQSVGVANDFQESTEIEIRISRTSGGDAGSVVIIPGAGLVGSFADLNKTGTTFSSPDWTGSSAAQNFYDYCKNVGMYADGIRFDTDNVLNYNGSIKIGERGPNGLVKGKKVNLSKFRLATGNTYANTSDWTDNNKYIVINSQFSMELSELQKGSFLSIFFNVVAVAKSVNISEQKL